MLPKKLTVTVIMLVGLVTLLSAQEMEDSLTVERDIQFLKEYLVPPELPMPSILSPDQLDFKSKEEVAAMVDMMVATDVPVPRRVRSPYESLLSIHLRQDPGDGAMQHAAYSQNARHSCRANGVLAKSTPAED